MTDEEYAWERMPPVGREFGSPDWERLAARDIAESSALKSMPIERSTPSRDKASSLGGNLVAVLRSMPAVGLDADFSCR